MTDLTKGIIEIEGFNLKAGVDLGCGYNPSPDKIVSCGKTTISSKTTSSELLSTYKEQFSPNMSCDTVLKFRMLFLICGIPFGCTFWFDNSGLISRIEMSPFIKYKSESWDRAGKQEERREFCDKWLFEQLGVPHKESANVTLYNYSNVEVYSISHFDLREGADAGHIIVKFLR